MDPRAASVAGQYLRAAVEGADRDDPIVALFTRGERTGIDALDDDAIAALEGCGLLRSDGDRLEPLARVSVWEGLILAHDPDKPGDIDAETVLGINNTTRTLASLTPRRSVARGLDVATGNGALALLQTRHCATVVATDLSERALRYALLNAALNDRNLDFRRGDLFAPVVGEQFDLITANLPFVVSPDTAFVFRDGGHGGDAVSRDAVIGAAHALNRGGTAVLLCNWLVPTGSDATDRPAEWVEDLGCIAVVVHHSTDEPEPYARKWNEFLLAQDPAEYTRVTTRWIDAYREWGVEGIASGAIILRRSADDSSATMRAVMAAVPDGDGGAQVLRALRNHELLARGEPSLDLLEARLALVRPHRLEQTMRYDGSWGVEEARMILGDTAGMIGRVDPLAIHVILRLDGKATLADVVDTAADDTGLEASTLRAAAIDTCRHLLLLGCLDRADP